MRLENTVSASQRRTMVVGLADMKATNNPGGQMATYALGACMGVAIFDPEARVAGLLHFILPDSGLSRQRALANPFFFADTGIPLLFRRAYKLGAVKERIICKLAGGAGVMDPDNLLGLGLRNHLAARQILSKNDVEVRGEYIGGQVGVALAINLQTGHITVQLATGEEIDL